MQKRLVEYGETRVVRVISYQLGILALQDVNDVREGYILIHPSLSKIPAKQEIGVITFVKDSGPLKGHWEYKPNAS